MKDANVTRSTTNFIVSSIDTTSQNLYNSSPSSPFPTNAQETKRISSERNQQRQDIENCMLSPSKLCTDVPATPTFIKDRSASEVMVDSSLETNWIVSNDSINPVPLHYPLADTSFVVGNRSAAVISHQISDLFRMNSIAAVFSSDRAIAKAFTQDHVEFFIRLFACGNHNEDYSKERLTTSMYQSDIIVEIQHTHGCPIRFHRVCQSICDTLKSGETCKGPGATVAVPRDNSIRQNGTESVGCALDKALDLLTNDRIDNHQLGMELLVFLTDTKLVHSQDAIYASRVVFACKDDDICYKPSGCTVHAKVFEHALRISDESKRKEEGLFATTMDEDDFGGNENLDTLPILGLTVIRNSLLTIKESSAINESDRKVPLWCTEKLLPTLIRVLDDATDMPHEACISATCLGCLMEISIEARNYAAGMKALPILERAYGYGKMRHASLAREAKCALDMLKCYIELELPADVDPDDNW